MADYFDQYIQGQNQEVLPQSLLNLLNTGEGSGSVPKDVNDFFSYNLLASPAHDPVAARILYNLGQESYTQEDINDLLMKINPSGTLSALLGTGAGVAAKKGEEAQMKAQQEAIQTLLEDLAPYRRAGEMSVRDASMLATRGGQEQFMKDNPFLQLMQGLTQSVGQNPTVGFTDGTMQGLEERLIGMGDQLVNTQMDRLMNLSRTGQASAAQVAEGGAQLAQGFGNIQAAGGMGQANAQGQGASNVATGVMALISAFSDPRLKDNAKMIGKYGQLGIYKWTWNEEAAKLGLVGDAIGHMADEVQRVYPELVTEKDGYLQVIYNADGKTLRL